MSVTGWLIAYFFRWFPHRAELGLFPIGTPDENSPVVATANFSLSVARVRRALAGKNLWLLVVNSEGINVWCAAAGGIFTEHRLIDAIKISGLADRVSHRSLILPALSAPGVDRGAVKEATGFRMQFGPVYAKDIPEYLAAGNRKSDRMCRFRFDLRHRLEMLPSMNFPVYLAIAMVLAIFWPQHLLGATLLFWSAMTVLYLLVDVIPGKTGWGQAALAAGAFALVWAAIDWITVGDPLRHWGWLLAAVAVFLAGGFDLAGIATPRKSDAEQFVTRLGFKKLGHLFSEKALGRITLQRDQCSGCGTCREVCPLEVYGQPDQDNKTTLLDRDACFACGACIKQCPRSALSFRAG